MKALASLRGAWLCADRNTRWLGVAFVGLAAFGGVAVELFSPHRHRAIYAMPILLGLGFAFWWAFVGGRLVLLQRDLRESRFPGASRFIAGCFGLTLLATVLLPAAILGLGGLPFLQVLALLVLCAGVGLLWAWLPLAASMWIGFLPLVANNLGPALGWPSMGDAGFTRFAALWAALFALTAIGCWRWLLGIDPARLKTWQTPMVLRLRCRGGGLSGGWLHAASLPDHGQTWIAVRPQANFDQRAKPARMLRVWLGPPFAPLSRQTRLRQALLAGVAAVLMAIAAFYQPTHSLTLAGIFWLIFFGAVMVPVMSYARLHLLYAGKRDSEIGELALLPGLGHTEQARRTLLRATLGISTLRVALGVVVALPALLLLHAARVSLPGTLLLAVISGLGSAAGMLYVLSGHSADRRRWWHYLVGAGGLIGLMALLTPLMVYAIGGSRAQDALPGWMLPALAAGWALLVVLLIATTRRYLRLFRQRPHPFLQR